MREKDKAPAAKRSVSFSVAPDFFFFCVCGFIAGFVRRGFHLLSSGAGRGFTTQPAELRHTAGVPPFRHAGDDAFK